jgi:cytosine/adenosine deaminase-related metal-dependent hydrolase
MSSALDRLKNLTSKISGYEMARKENLKTLEELYNSLHVSDKITNFSDLFLFKAINLSGASLKAEELGVIQKGKYLQILAIAYDKEAKVKSKNLSLAYFGRAENVDEKIKNDVVAFILRWRFEKSFMTLEHYHNLLETHTGA